jgi:hypothetical protein
VLRQSDEVLILIDPDHKGGPSSSLADRRVSRLSYAGVSILILRWEVAQRWKGQIAYTLYACTSLCAAWTLLCLCRWHMIVATVPTVPGPISIVVVAVYILTPRF